MSDLPNEELRPEHVPGADAPWHPTIAEFALTFDGYEAMGNRLHKYAERRFARWRTDGSLPRDLLHLRSCLFMEQRGVRWSEYGPSPGPTAEQLAYAHALIAAIRTYAEKTTGHSRPSSNDEAERRVSVEIVPDEKWAEPVTTAERARILDDGMRLLADVLWSDDEVLRWRRYLKVANRYGQCVKCGLWTERRAGCPCTNCAVVPDTDAPADFLIRSEGMTSLLSPLTERARAWVYENISDHIEYTGSVVIEAPDVHDILTGIIDDGLSII